MIISIIITHVPICTFILCILHSPPVLKDLEAIEPGIYSSLIWIQENDPEPLDLTFTVEEEAFGQVRTRRSS